MNALLELLSNPSFEGKVIVTCDSKSMGRFGVLHLTAFKDKDPRNSSVKYVLLHPERAFKGGFYRINIRQND